MMMMMVVMVMMLMMMTMMMMILTTSVTTLACPAAPWAAANHPPSFLANSDSRSPTPEQARKPLGCNCNGLAYFDNALPFSSTQTIDFSASLASKSHLELPLLMLGMKFKLVACIFIQTASSPAPQ